MRLRGLKFGWLIGLLVLGTGASPRAVTQAEEWHREAEMARTFGQWDIVYDRSLKALELFPGMPHGRLALRLVLRARDRMIHPARASASDGPVSWVNEVLDFVTWP